jgi:4-oxalocrotonate tautomerase
MRHRRHTLLHTAREEHRRHGYQRCRENEIPVVTVKVGVFTQEQKQKQKQEMIRRITDTMVEIEGENLRPVTWVLVEEVHSGDWGIAGNGLTTADVHALQAQSAAVG